ncbi:hypothetical protein [Halobacteriaceae bacterium SHR40]|uniref:hypothetical protein n=1 Tax=Halovenus amylolytica TaxID=2500550 RepID=UPI000FE2C91B
MVGVQTRTGSSVVAFFIALLVATGLGLIFGDGLQQSLVFAAPIAIGMGVGFYLFADTGTGN